MTMKNRIIYFLQKILGFERYLFVFSIFFIIKLKWDKKEKDFLKLFELIKDDGVVLDIGANIGGMTTHFARNLKNSVVYAFEPVNYNVNTLNKIVSLFKLSNVKIMNVALSDVDTMLHMVMPVVRSVKKQGLTRVKNGHYIEGEEFVVPGIRLDKIEDLANLDKKITAIKIDVEGYELNVLKGAFNTLKKHKPIIYCELWPGEQRANTIEYLKAFKYTPKVLVQNELVDYENHATQNFFFIPN